jgi:hypothetical protein
MPLTMDGTTPVVEEALGSKAKVGVGIRPETNGAESDLSNEDVVAPRAAPLSLEDTKGAESDRSSEG